MSVFGYVLLTAAAVPVLSVLFFFYFLFFSIPSFGNIFRHCRTEIRNYNGVDCLFYQGLPCHTCFTETTRKKIDVSGKWQLDLTGKEVDIPHCCNIFGSEFQDYTGPAEYEREIPIPRSFSETPGPCHLVLEGSFLKTTVSVNGKESGTDYSGYLPFRIDITEYLADANPIRVTVKTDNTPDRTTLPPQLYQGHGIGFHPFGGIHKKVRLEKLPPCYCFKCRAEADPEAERENLRLSLAFRDSRSRDGIHDLPPFRVQLRVQDPSGREVFHSTEEVPAGTDVIGLSKTVTVKNPRLWQPGSPHLYRLEAGYPGEEFAVEFGFVKTAVSGGKLRVNGTPIELRGICRHEDDPAGGFAVTEETMDRELELIQELGVNLIRLVHYPHHPGFLERCDREGIMTWCEIPLYQAGMAPVKYLSAKKSAGRESGVTKILRLPGMIFRTRQASDPKLISRSRDSLLRMIERDCNHPSIRFWGIGNECWTLNPAGARALHRLKETAESSDRSRLPGYAAMTIPGLTEKFERSFRVMDFIGINEYFGWYYGETRDTEGFLRRLSRGFPGKPLLVTETGADCARGVRNGQQEPERGVSEEYQSRFLREQLSAVSGVPAAAGVCVWVLKDFLCPEYGAENPVPFHNAKGLIDREYRKKASFDTVKGIFRKEEKGE